MFPVSKHIKLKAIKFKTIMNKTLVIILCHSKKNINGMSNEPRKLFASCTFVTLLHVVKK